VDYRTEDGTANAGSDFTFATGTLIFQPGETERHIEISIIDDDVFEEDEHFFVNLNNVRNEGDTEATTGQPRIRAYSKRVPRTNCALRIKKCAPRISSGIYFLSTS